MLEIARGHYNLVHYSIIYTQEAIEMVRTSNIYSCWAGNKRAGRKNFIAAWNTKEELELSIAQEQIKRPRLTREEILVWIKKFRHGDIDDLKYQKRIIDSFVNSVYLYDNKIILSCNYSEGSTTITFDEINNSDLKWNASPQKTA